MQVQTHARVVRVAIQVLDARGVNDDERRTMPWTS